MNEVSETKVVRTVCTVLDVFACGLSVEVENGVITKIIPAHMPDPADRGACRKGLAAAELIYHKDRLRYPLKRVGKRGEGKWERIAWDEAMDDIAGKFRQIVQRYESRSIAWAVKGYPETLKAGGYLRLASLLKGSRVSLAGLGDSAAPCADIATFGCLFGEAHLSRVKDPNFTIVWGYNPDVTDWRRMRRIMESKKKGCKVVVIDPRRTTTASRAADWYIPIRPGTDTALVLAMINIILEQGLHDKQFITERTVGPLLVRSDNGMLLREHDVREDGSPQLFMVLDANTGEIQVADSPGVKPALTGSCFPEGIECRSAFQLLSDMVKEYTPDRVSEITEIPVDIIRNLAIEYAIQKPASIHRGWGLQRTFYGDLTCRALNTLAAISGNINPHIPSSFIEISSTFSIPAGRCTTIPVMSVFEQIASQKPFPIKALWFASNNFVSQSPNRKRIIEKLFPQLELIVVSDLFMTETARYADYVFPVSSSFECTDFHYGLLSWTNHMHLQQKVIEPLYETKPDFMIAAELAKKMDLGEYFNKSEEQYLDEILTAPHPLLEGISLERLKAGPVPERIIDKAQKLRTPTGRVEFYLERLKTAGQELPCYIEPVESVYSKKAKEYPLSLLTSHPRYRVHTMMGNYPVLMKKDPEPNLQINPSDAKHRNIKDGDIVRVFNNLGQVKLKAALSENIKPGVVNIDEGWWPEQYIEGHINELTHDMINLAQAMIFEPNAAYCDVLVEVEKI
ncbi:MAG: molybdopterin-dependent oxidoreductase [Proteobacteria bacterium]|nr:molybdopterin-dependent oxidoreductase [Pseudomonadota bacterium]